MGPDMTPEDFINLLISSVEGDKGGDGRGG